MLKRVRAAGRLVHAVTFAVVLAYLGASGVHAGDVVNTRIGDVAILGYDPVAYFTEDRAVKGSADFSYEWLGATWHFASVEHRDAFASEPVRFAPQYGGFCTLSVSQGGAANVDPEAWRIVDGKLYLFNSTDGLEGDFDAVSADVIGHADENWPAVQAKLTGN